MSWKDLDIKLKAELIKVGIRSGIKDINLIKQLYDNVDIKDYLHPYYTNKTVPKDNILSLNQDNTLIKGMIDEFNKNKHNIPQLNIYTQNGLGTERINTPSTALFLLFKGGGYISNNPTLVLANNIKKYAKGGYGDGDEGDEIKSYLDDKTVFIKDWLTSRADILDKNAELIERKRGEGKNYLDALLENLENTNEYMGASWHDNLAPHYSNNEFLRNVAINNYENITGNKFDLDPNDISTWDKLGRMNNYIGAYYGDGNIIYNEEFLDNDPLEVIIHERTHALNAHPLKFSIRNLNIQPLLGNKHEYWDDPNEIYSRLMEFRHANKLDPKKVYTTEDIKKFKEDSNVKDFEILNRYNEEDVLKLLNDIAYNQDSPIINMAKNGGYIKKYAPGGYTDSQPISYKTWKDYLNLENTKQGILENLAMLQYADNKATYGDDVPEEAKYLYDMGLLPEVEVAAVKNLTKKESYLADLQWSNYLATHPIEIGSDEYNRLPEKAKAQVYKNKVTDAIDKAALPTAAAIIAPTALTAGAASLVGSGALTAAADAAGKVGTKIAGINLGGTTLGLATSAFFSNPYIDGALTTIGAYTVPSLYNRGVLNIKEGNYGRAAGDFGSIAVELLGAAGTAFNLGNKIHKLSEIPKMIKRGYSATKKFFINKSKNPKFWKVLDELGIRNYEIKDKTNRLRYGRDVLILDKGVERRSPLYGRGEENKIKEIYPDLEYTKGDVLDAENWEYTNHSYISELLSPIKVNHKEVYDNNMSKVSEILLDTPFKMTGSSVLHGKGVTYSQKTAGDADFLMKKKDALALADKYGLQLNRNGTAFTKSHINGIEVNPLFIDETNDGFAIGRVGVLYFQLKYPKEWLKFVDYCYKNDLNITTTPLPIKAEKLFDDLTEEDIIVRSLMDNMISSSPSNEYNHMLRTIHSLFSTDLDNVKYYKKALKNLMEAFFGEYRDVKTVFPNIKFDDIDNNVDFLKQILEVPVDNTSILPLLEKIASDPERMEVIANSYLLTYSTSARHTLGRDNVYKGNIVDRNSGLGVNIINPKGAVGGGNASGAGTNTSLSKAPEGYGHYESIFNYPITYTPEKYTKLSDISNLVENLNNSSISKLFADIADFDMSVDTERKLQEIEKLSTLLDFTTFINPYRFKGYSGILSDPYTVKTVRIGDNPYDVNEGFFEMPHEMLNIGKAFPDIRTRNLVTKSVMNSDYKNKEQFLQHLKEREKFLLEQRNAKIQAIDEEIVKIEEEMASLHRAEDNTKLRINRVLELQKKYDKYRKLREALKIHTKNALDVGIIGSAAILGGYGVYEGIQHTVKNDPSKYKEVFLRKNLEKELLALPLFDGFTVRDLRKLTTREMQNIILDYYSKQHKHGGYIFPKGVFLYDK